MRVSAYLFLFLFMSTSLFADSVFSQINLWLTGRLDQSMAGPMVYIISFLGGAIASLLPCTYPLYPITVKIIQGRTTGSKYLHPFLYYLGMVFMYFLFGIIAALSGGAFNQIMQFAASQFAIGLLILILGLASLELLFLPLFSHSGIEVQEGKFGTFILGMAAGLLSSPCVGPVVVTLLLMIIGDGSQISFLTVFSAATKMAFFGAGVGIPFFLFGIIGLKLPRSGKWMKWFQIALGLFILYLSYDYLQKGFTMIGWQPRQSGRFLAMSLLLFFAIYFFLPAEQTRPQRVQKSLSALLASIAFWAIGLMILPSSTGTQFKKSSTEAKTGQIEQEKTGNLSWYRKPEDAYRKARENGQKIFIDFYADWCTNCKKFSQLAIQDPALNEALSQSVLLKIYDTDKAYDTFAMDPQYQELNVGLPFFVILDTQGNFLYKTSDYQATKQMIKNLQ